MKRDNINYFTVGLFVIGMFVALLLLLYQLSGRGKPMETYTVVYENVAGLQSGTPVLYEGYQVGQVENIKPFRQDDGMHYRLRLRILEDWQIPEDSVARVVASGLLSSMTIEIREGRSRQMLKPGDEIRGREASNLFATVNDVAGELQRLSQESIQPLLDSVRENTDQLAAELLDLTRQDIRPLFRDMRQTMEETDFVRKADQLVVKLNGIADNLDSLFDASNRDNVAGTLENLNAASKNLNELLNDFDNTRAQMEKVMTGVDTLVEDNREDLGASVNELRATMESISGNIDSIIYHLEGSSRNLHEFSRHIRANPGVLLRGSSEAENDAAGDPAQ